MKFLPVLFLLLLLQPTIAQPHQLMWRIERLDRLKAATPAQDSNDAILRNALIRDGAAFMQLKPASVMDKQLIPPSGDKHDYMSQAPYFWYDSSKPNGLPYLRRDGERNPEINKITDRKNLGELGEAVSHLAIAGHLSGDKRYGEKAVQLLHAWFIDTATRMHPHLDFGQGIPGVNTGRGIGIIETISLTAIADAVLLMAHDGALSTSELEKLKDWYRQYLGWMLTSANGKDEHAAKNNHGTWYLVQAVDFALFTGNIAQAQQLIGASKKLMEGQFAADGSQPLELERTNALWYSTYNLEAWFRLATLAAQAGVDLWHQTNTAGAGIQRAMDWLMPYALSGKPFPYKQIDGYNRNVYLELVMQAAKQYPQRNYELKAGLVPGDFRPLSLLSY
jgi:hypothetical protein